MIEPADPQPTTHSPSPWEFNKTETLIMAKGDCGRFTVCLIQNRHKPEQAANKKLILAAPDMLDELQAGIETAQDVIDTWAQGDLAAAVNALEDWMKAAQVIVAKAQPTTQGE